MSPERIVALQTFQLVSRIAARRPWSVVEPKCRPVPSGSWMSSVPCFRRFNSWKTARAAAGADAGRAVGDRVVVCIASSRGMPARAGK
jgi:hypothetical protein